MTKIEHIAIDMDDVMLDFVGGLKAAVKLEYGVEITDEQLAACGWNLHPLLDPILGRSWWKWLKEREWLWANFPAIEGSIGAVEKLRQHGYVVELVTSKPSWAAHNVWKWLGKWRPAFDRVTIVRLDQNKIDWTEPAGTKQQRPRRIQLTLLGEKQFKELTR